MHVALFTPAWPPGTVANGIVTYVAAMRAELLRQGHRVSLFSPDVRIEAPDVHPVAASPTERVVDALVARLSRRDRTVFDLGKTIAATIRRVHARDPIDVVEMEESFGWVGAVAAATSLPVVCKLHGPAFLTLVAAELATELGREKVRREGEALARLAVIVAPSRYTLKETLAHYSLHPAASEHVVNPVAPPERLELWDPVRCERDRVLFVGRFDAVKGGDLMVLAFQRLLARRPGARLAFVGPDPGVLRSDGSAVRLRDFIASLGDRALADAITTTGAVAPAQVAELRPRAAVTVVASRRESQGYTALEAMLQACPVVVTDTSGLSEIVEQGVTGLKARPDDPEDLARQIERVLDDRELARSLGAAGRAFVLREHAPAAVVATMLAVYRRAIEARGAPALAGQRNASSP
jgi:glycosyltransferase involved in cell wall biosynthesis